MTHDKTSKNSKQDSSAAIARAGIAYNNVGQPAGSVPSLNKPRLVDAAYARVQAPKQAEPA